MGGHGHGGGRPQGQQGEEQGAGPVGVAAALRQEQRLQVVAQGDGWVGRVRVAKFKLWGKIFSTLWLLQLYTNNVMFIETRNSQLAISR